MSLIKGSQHFLVTGKSPEPGIVLINDLDTIFSLDSFQDGIGIDAEMPLEMSTLAFGLREERTMGTGENSCGTSLLYFDPIFFQPSIYGMKQQRSDGSVFNGHFVPSEMALALSRVEASEHQMTM
jgi:hypothetical protein